MFMFMGGLLWDKWTHKERLFQILSTAAKKAITRKWFKPQTPTIEEWFEMIYLIFKMERITFLKKKREGWIEFIKHVTVDWV